MQERQIKMEVRDFAICKYEAEYSDVDVLFRRWDLAVIQIKTEKKASDISLYVWRIENMWKLLRLLFFY